MRMKKINWAIVFSAMLLSACSSVGESKGTDAIPALGDNFSYTEEITENTASEAYEPSVSAEQDRPAETWAETDEPPLETTENTEKTPHEGEITDIDLTYYEIDLDEGDSSMPYVTMYPEDAPDKSEIWTSSDENVATVDEKGNITAVAMGRCIVKVQSEVCPEVYAEVIVTVGGYEEPDEITDIELTYYDITLDAGDTSMPYVTMYPEEASDKSEIWTSSDEKVAVVDGKGNITAVSQGECIIKVQSEVSPNVFAEVRVTVNSDDAHNDSDGIRPAYIDGILVVNKSYPLPSDYNPGVNSEAQAAFDKMQAAAAEEGLNIYISSGFRSYEYQAELYESYVKKSGKAEADRYSARAGYSEHQSGLAFDLNTIDISFADTEEYGWLRRHCYEYGFIIRYPQNGESKTGYMYEPWHIRYLGTETAKKVYNSGLTLEEYLGIDSKYAM